MNALHLLRAATEPQGGVSSTVRLFRGPGNLALLRLDSGEPPADLLRRILDTCLKYMHQHKATP